MGTVVSTTETSNVGVNVASPFESCRARGRLFSGGIGALVRSKVSERTTRGRATAGVTVPNADRRRAKLTISFGKADASFRGATAFH